ncbi:MAG TPA: protein kinase [Actinocrinis sp.]|nr:protein kinase [Actinocrinis sp.]
MVTAWGSSERLIDGRFELLERLGAGGMGTVWRAYDAMLHREVALKEVTFHDAASPFDPVDAVAARVMRERTLREARALARLHHPNVVTIYHIVDSAEAAHPWLVMELVTGGSLADRLKRGPLAPLEAAGIGRGVLAALRAAHAAGIQHRDVKPANVLLRPDGSPVLTDFGIAALRESAGLTATGSLIGSPEYIAPERIRGEEGDPASDLWSLAMLLYVALEGHNPLHRDTAMATLAAVLDAPIPSPTRAGPLAPVLSAMLVREAAARPDAARFDHMLAQIEHGPVNPAPMNGAPVSGVSGFYAPGPVQPNWAPPVEDQVPGHRSKAFTAGAVATALLGVAGALVWTLHGSNGAASQSSSRTSAPASATAGGALPVGAPGASTTPASAADSEGLLTPASVRTAISALQGVVGGGKFKEIYVTASMVTAQAQTKADKSVYDNYIYRGGTASDWTAGSTLSSDDVLFDPAVIDWDALPALLHAADTQLGITHPTNQYIVATGDVSGTEPALLVFTADAYGSAYLIADAKGRVLQKFPRTSH